MDQEIQNTLKVLDRGGIILYPTDTVWGIGCDATNYQAIKRIYTLKNRIESKSMICLMSDFDMLNRYVETVPKEVFDILKKNDKPTTIIYNNPMGISENLIPKDNSLAIRIIQHKFCNNLIKIFNKPIVSTSANITNNQTPKSFKEIHKDILKGVDYIVNLQSDRETNIPSKIIKLKNDGSYVVIRA